MPKPLSAVGSAEEISGSATRDRGSPSLPCRHVAIMPKSDGSLKRQVECCCGVRPSQAANCLPEENRSASVTVAAYRCCRDDAEAGDRGKSATGLALGMPSGKLLIQPRNLGADGHDLADQCLQCRTGLGWQGIAVGHHLLGQLGEVTKCRGWQRGQTQQDAHAARWRAWSVAAREGIGRDGS